MAMELPLSSLPPSPLPSRLILELLVASSIRRCVASGGPCRITVSLRCFHDSQPSPRVQMSVSDTGLGICLRELQIIADYFLKTMDKWDGTLSASTTCIGDTDVFSYRSNLMGTSITLMRLPPKPKNGSKFSGTQISLTAEIEEDIEEHLVWVKGYVGKIAILNIPMIAFEILVDHIKDTGSPLDHIQFSDGVFLPISLSSLDRITSGLQEFLVKHGHVLDQECPSCSADKDNLKIGSGYATSENRKGNGQIVEAVIAIFNLEGTSNNSCSWRTAGLTKVLFFQNFVPCSMSLATLNAVKGISWPDYGLCLRTGAVDGDGQAILEWNNLTINASIDLAIHCYDKQYPSSDIHFQDQTRAPDKSLLKKAVKFALDNLKSKHVGALLSHHALKIRNYAPDLSRSIANIILSSKDLSFQGECASLLGLEPLDIKSEGKLESFIRDKITEIIDVNDRNPKRSRQSNPSLFEQECLDDEECLAEYYEQQDGGCVLNHGF